MAAAGVAATGVLLVVVTGGGDRAGTAASVGTAAAVTCAFALAALVTEIVRGPRRVGQAVAHAVTTLERDHEAVASSRARFRAAFDQTAIPIVIVDTEGTVRDVNTAFADLLQAPHTRFVGRPLEQWVATEDRAELRQGLTRVRARRLPAAHLAVTVVTGEGDARATEVTVTAADETDAASALVVQLVDVTDRRRATDLLATQADLLEMVARGAPVADTADRLLRTLEHHLPDAVAVLHTLDDEGGRLRVLAGLDDLPVARAGLDEREVSATAGPLGPVAHFAHPVAVSDTAEDPLWAADADLASALGARACYAVPVLGAADHRVRGVLSVYWPNPRVATDAERDTVRFGAHIAAVALERHALDAGLEHHLLHDPLTGLPNRALFADRLHHALARAERRPGSIAVLLVDIDRFQFVNDCLGPVLADQVLQHVGRRLAGVLRPADTLARHVGDQFIVLCDDHLGPDGADRLAARLTAAVREPLRVDGNDLHLTASIGVAVHDGRRCGDPDAVALDLIRGADTAVRVAKDRGRARWVVFDDSMREKARRQIDTERLLRHAIERDELWVAYQPIVDLATGQVTSLEALARWTSSERGPVSPVEFIPVAEENGMIHDLGLLVLDRALEAAAAWRDGGHPVRVNVNLSARQLSHPGLVPSVRRALARTGVAPEQLCLEVTESVLVDDTAALKETLSALCELGVTLAVDDFGTGYSSLTYLQRFPFRILKIDGSFVHQMDESAESRLIVEAIVDLAHNLGLRVVAEGVETPAQLHRLHQLGCDEAQGYLFRHPVPAEAATTDLGRTLMGGSTTDLPLPSASA